VDSAQLRSLRRGQEPQWSDALMIGQPPVQTRPDQRNGRPATVPPPADASPSFRDARLRQGGHWARWVLGVIALVALVYAFGCIGLFIAGQAPVAWLVYVVMVTNVVALLAVIVSPPVYSPPTK